jgi:inner membrane protein
METLYALGHNPWYWLVLGAVFLCIEMTIPGVFMLWLGLAACATGLVIAVVPLSFPVYALVFSVCALMSVYAGIRLQVKPSSKNTTLNNLENRMLNTIHTLDEPVTNGHGRLKVGDTYWQIASKTDVPIHAKVRVIKADGAILHVVEA